MLRQTFLILLIGFTGCTEKVSIAPQFGDATSWTPVLSVENNNYHRVQLHFGEPPLEVERNLSNIVIRFRKAGEQGFRDLDTLNLEFVRLTPTSYTTEPVLDEDVEYEFRALARYRNGNENVSNTVSLTTPVVKGQILESIPITPPDFGCSGCAPSGFGFNESSVFVLTFDDRLIQVDRSSSEITELLDEFRPSDPRVSVSYLDMAVHGDTAIVAENTESEPDRMTVVRVNLKTLAIDKSLQIQYPKDGNYVYGRILHYDGSDIYVLWTMDAEQQIERLNATTGAVVESHAVFQLVPDIFDGLVFDGIDFWINIRDAYDNRINRFDPDGTILPPVHRNPVFRTHELAWYDGFWVFDEESYAIVKLELDGL